MYRLILTSLLAVMPVSSLAAGDSIQIPDPLPDPDGKSADMSKPVQVYILMGQSNMLGFGKVDGLKDACQNKGLYPYLTDDAGDWTTRKDVRFVRVMCSGSGPSKTHNNEWMTVKGRFGPEHGIGHYVGHVTKAPVMILKSCIGNRSLGYDLRPPTADGYAGNPGRPRKPKSGPWYAGVQYDGDVAAAKKVLANLGKHYPGAGRYQVAGFFFWQGDKDFRNADHAAAYEKNLLCLIESLRADFNAPKAKFVCATLGQTKKNAGGPQGKILEAQLNIDGERGKYRSHKGLVATVYSHPLSKGGSSSGHYGGNPETYMNIGQAMGRAMARLILNSPGSVPGIDVDRLDGSLKSAHKSILAGKLNQADKSLRAYLDAGGKSEDQLGHARKLNEHVNSLVDGLIKDLEAAEARGDYCYLRDSLAENGRNHQGIAAFDRQQGAWSTALASDKAVREMALGDEFEKILARKKKASEGAYFAMLADFKQQNSSSFYAAKANAELATIQKELAKTLEVIEAFGKKGDLYSKFRAIKECRIRFAKIPEFDKANAQWTEEAKSPEARKAMSAGSAYEAIFEELAKLDDRLKQGLAKAKKITSKNKRAKTEQRATADYERKLKALAAKMEKLANRNGGSYYGKAAGKSYETFVATQGTKLLDMRK